MSTHTNEIGPAVTRVRRLATAFAEPINGTPAANIGQSATDARRLADATSNPRGQAPAANIGEPTTAVRPSAKQLPNTNAAAHSANTPEIGAAETSRRPRSISGSESKCTPSAAPTEAGNAAPSMRRATIKPNPRFRPPSASPHEIAPAETPKRGRRAIALSKPTTRAPAVQPIASAGNDAGGGDVHASVEPRAIIDIPAIVAQLVSMQRDRLFAIKAKSQCDRRMERLIASKMSYRIDLDEIQRRAIFRKAGALMKAVERVQHDPDTEVFRQYPGLVEMIQASGATRAPWDKMQKRSEADMEKTVQRLPIAAFAAGIRGFGRKGLAMIIGECGIPIGDYRTVSGVWSRLGLAVVNGERQQKKTNMGGGIHCRYNPERRAQVYVVGESLFKAQWHGAKDEDGNNPKDSGKPIAIPPGPTGPYGRIYLARREYTAALNAAGKYAERAAKIVETDKKLGKAPNAENLAGRLTAGHLHKDAMRIMTKALIKHVYLTWRDPAYVPNYPIETAPDASIGFDDVMFDDAEGNEAA
jgi:hypothetical protein